MRTRSTGAIGWNLNQISMSDHLTQKWGSLVRTSMPSWRPLTTTDQQFFWQVHDVVIATSKVGRGRSFEVWTYGEPFSKRTSLDEARASVEDVYGPLQWHREIMPRELAIHRTLGPTVEFSDPLTVWWADLPLLGYS
jgi:hypothetical protein